MNDKIDLTGTLSTYIAGEQAARLPQAALDKGKTHILDTIGAMISGSQLKPGRLIVDFVRTQGGHTDATAVAGDLRTSLTYAALAK
jgi:2-methylcitrate dehydratase PrpD